jgi:H+/Na+-translocating ferredoxin:NAD+ oxidoreductase subunit D
MNSQKKYIVSHAPFWHNGSGVPERHFNAIIALIPAVLMGLVYYGVPALAVLCLSVSSAVGWEVIFDKAAKRPVSVGDGQAALIGLLLGLLLPATSPWWLVVTGTLMSILIGKQVYGGIGANPFNPAVLGYAILTIAWHAHFDFDAQLANIDFNFIASYPPAALKAFGPAAVAKFNLLDLFLGRQIGGIGSTCGLALTIGGVYLILRGYVRWEIPVAFILGLVITAALFKVADPSRYAGPFFHLFTGYSLIGAFFLATEDSSSPVNQIPMLIFGAAGGMMTILIRNIGAYPDGVMYAILVINLINPLLDKIRPKAIGKVA